MILLATSTLAGYGLHHIFLLAKQAGFDGIHLSLRSHQFDEWAPQYVEQIAKLYDLPIVSIDTTELEMTSELFERVCALGEALHITRIHVSPLARKAYDVAWFGELSDLSKRYPFSVAITNVEPKTTMFFLSDYANATLPEIKKVTGNTVFTLDNVDTSSGLDMAKTLSLLGNSIVSTIVADRLGWQVHMFPGAGDLPLISTLKTLRENGYKGDFVVRIDPSQIPVGITDNEISLKLAEAKHFILRHGV